MRVYGGVRIDRCICKDHKDVCAFVFFAEAFAGCTACGVRAGSEFLGSMRHSFTNPWVIEMMFFRDFGLLRLLQNPT